MTDLSISLGQLLHLLIQSTYHELSQLSELLPTRTDMERKIQLAKFSRKSNHQFVRLLALANWASSPETSNNLSTFTAHLDMQSGLYVETADTLFLQEKETLKGSELPQFCIVSAIDILRTCTFSFLPTCISKRMLPLSNISESEKFSTLHKLDQNLRLRLINLVPTLPYSLTPSLNLFPKGCLTMRVPSEFKAKLTLLSEDPAIPWRLIQLDFLVRDQKSFDNRPLIHSRQKLLLQYLVQSRLFKQVEENVLSEVYQLLHSFCISLQLQVLYTQLIQLTKHWGKHNLEVEEYIPGEKLRLAYWCTSPMHLILDMHCSITISAMPSYPTLVYYHCDGSNNLSDRSDFSTSGVTISSYHNVKPLKSDKILVDKLIHLCIENKSFHALKCISKCLSDKGWSFPVYLRKSPPALILNLRFTDLPNMLVISKDPRNGRLQCIIFDYYLSPNNLFRKKVFRKSMPSIVQKHLDELAKCIFDHINYSTEYLTQFRAQYRLWHFEQQVLEMNLCVSSRLPLLNEEALPNIYNFREKDSKISTFYFRIFIKLPTPFYYLILSVCPDISSQSPGHLNENLYLLHTQESPFTFHEISNSRYHKNKLDSINTSIYRELSNNGEFQEKSFSNLPTSFLTVCKVFHLGSDMIVCDGFDFSLAPLQRRRMRSYGSQFIFTDENIRFISLSKLSDLIFTLDNLISIFHLQHSLKQANNLEHFLVSSQALQLSSRTLILVLPPCPSNVSKPIYYNFCKYLYYCRFALMPNKQWLAQLVFSSPIIFSNKTHHNLSYNLCNGASLFEQFCSDFESILMLYGSLVEFSVYLQSSPQLRKKFQVKLYIYTQLSIVYCGEEMEFSPGALINIFWNSNQKKFHLEFINIPQSFAQSSYEEAFNCNYSIPQLLFGLLKLFPFYRLIEQSTLNSRIRFQAGPFPGIIRLVFKLFIDFEIHNNNKIIIHPHRHESNERVFNLLEQFIESFKFGEINSRDILDTSSLQIPAIVRSYSLSSGSPGFPLKPFSPASKFPSIAQTPFTASKASPFFPNSSAFTSKTHQLFFPTDGFEYLYTSRKYLSKSIPFSTFKFLLLPKKKPINPPLANFLAAVHLLDYDRLVNFGGLPTLDSSRIKLEADSFSIFFDNINVTVFLETNFMDLGIKLSQNEHICDQSILKEHDIFALESYFHSSKIKAPTFSSNALCCYLKLMSSHTNLIKTAAFIFRNYRNPPSDWLWQPELCLTVPEHSPIMPSDDLSINPGFTCLFSFPIKKIYMLYLRFLPLKQDHGPILDLIFIYDYKQNRIDLKTYGISTSGNCDLIGSSIRQILTNVNSNISAANETDCSLLLAVKEISKHLEI